MHEKADVSPFPDKSSLPPCERGNAPNSKAGPNQSRAFPIPCIESSPLQVGLDPSKKAHSSNAWTSASTCADLPHTTQVRELKALAPQDCRDIYVLLQPQRPTAEVESKRNGWRPGRLPTNVRSCRKCMCHSLNCMLAHAYVLRTAEAVT